MLKLEQITVQFRERTLFSSLSCSVQAGEITVIVGHNGAGKSTLLNVMMGRVRPTAGRVMFYDQEITRQKEHERAMWISNLFQDPQMNCVLDMTVAQNIALAQMKGESATFGRAMRLFTEDAQERLDKALGYSVAPLLHTPLSALSGGQRQIISFVMATLKKPHILLLDEPTAALDPNASTRLISLAIEKTRAEKSATVIITHDPQLALAVADRIWILEQGSITKTFDKQMISRLDANDLVGHVDYRKLHEEARN